MSYEVMDKNRIPEYARAWQELLNYSVEIGIFQNSGQYEDRTSILLIANVNEFGCNIEVTPKMRAYLHYQGLHLNPSTKEIRIPERSFIRSGFDDRVDRIRRDANIEAKKALTLKKPVEKCLKWIGDKVAGELKSYLTTVEEPPNHPFTIAEKGGSGPLRGKSSRLVDTISFRVVKR